MNVVLAVFVVVAFAFTIERLSLPDRAREVVRRSSDSLEVLRNPALTDATKEVRLRRESVSLFRLLGLLVGGSLLAIALPLLVVWLLAKVGVSSLDAVLSVLERIDFLATVTVAGTVLYLAYRRLGSG